MALAWAESVMVDVITNTDASTEKSNYLHCDRTNFRVPVSEWLKTEWTGYMVRAESFEHQPPQDFVKSRGGDKEIGPQSPEGDDVFITSHNTVTIDDL